MSDVALRFTAREDGLSAQFARATKQLDDFDKHARSVGDRLGSTLDTVKRVVAGVSFAALAREALQFADSMEKASDRTGIAVDKLQGLAFLGDQLGVGFETIVGSINKMQRSLVQADDGAEAVTSALQRLGLSVGEVINMAPDQAFQAIASALSEIGSPTERTAIAMDLFSRSGAELLPVLTQNSEELNKLAAQFDRLGGAVSAENIRKVDDLGDAFGRLKLQVKSLAVELLALGADVGGNALLQGAMDVVGALRVIATGGLDEFQKIENLIRFLEEQRESFLPFVFNFGDERLGDQVFLTTGEIDQKLAELRRRQALLLGLGEEGVLANAFKPQAITVDEDVGLNLPTIIDPDAEATAEERRTAFLNQELVDFEEQAVQLEELNQTHLDELLRQQEEFVLDRSHIESDGQRFLADVREAYGNQQITFENTKNQHILEIASGLFTALARENSRLAKIQQGIALAETIWATIKGVQQAISKQQWAVAGKIALKGAIAVAKIKATNYSAGGSVSGGSLDSVGGGASFNAQADQANREPVPAGATQRPQMSVVINSTGWSREALRELVGELRTEFDEYDLSLFGPNSFQAQIVREG